MRPAADDYGHLIWMCRPLKSGSQLFRRRFPSLHVLGRELLRYWFRGRRCRRAVLQWLATPAVRGSACHRLPTSCLARGCIASRNLATCCRLSDCCLAGCRFATDSLPGCGLAHGRLATSSLTRSRFASDGLPGCGLARCGLATCSLTRSRFTTDGLPCCSLACSRLAGSSWSAASCHKSLGYARPRCARMDIVFLITRTGLYWPVSGARGLHRQLLACTALCTR